MQSDARTIKCIDKSVVPKSNPPQRRTSKALKFFYGERYVRWSYTELLCHPLGLGLHDGVEETKIFRELASHNELAHS